MTYVNIFMTLLFCGSYLFLILSREINAAMYIQHGLLHHNLEISVFLIITLDDTKNSIF